MSFDPNDKNPFDDLFSERKRKPEDEVLGMFSSGNKEFEPIDDEDDEPVAVPPFANVNTNDPAPADDVKGKRGRVAGRTALPDHPPSEEVESSANEMTGPPKSRKSHWEKLAAALGLSRGKSKSSSDEPSSKPTISSVPEARKSMDVVQPMTFSDRTDRPENEALDEMFSASETYVEPEPRMVDDVTPELESDPSIAAEQEGYIEFEVEDLDPRQSARGRRRRPRRRGGRDRVAEDNLEIKPSSDLSGNDAISTPSVRPDEGSEETADEDRPRKRRRRRRRSSSSSADQPVTGQGQDEPICAETADREELRPTADETRGPKDRGEGRSRRERDRPRGKRRERSVESSDLDEEDDFIEIDHSDSDRKSITTWRQVVNVVVDRNIENHNKGRGRSRSPNRRRS